MATETTPATADADSPTNAPDIVIAPPAEDEALEAEDDDAPDSAFGGSNSASDWTSVTSSIYKGVIMNGRRYQSLKEGEYWGPSDEQQFESQANSHLTFMLYDQFEENPYFRAPIGEKATHVLDIGTGDAQWAIDVADKFPNVTVYGVDLHPPPQTWVAPNCILEVDDVTQRWTWAHKFDLVHLRFMMGSFTQDQWKKVYREAYKNLEPGGWIEQVEPTIHFQSDDGTVESDPVLSNWGPIFYGIGKKVGRHLDTINTMRAEIEEAGFEVKGEKNFKFAHGSWPKHPLHKEIGRLHLKAAKLGLEGYAMYLLTTFGEPEPWTPEQVQLMLMQVRKQLDGRTRHSYTAIKRIWAQKPFDKPATETET